MPKYKTKESFLTFITVLTSLMIFNAQAAAPPLLFTSYTDQTIKFEVQKHKGGALFIDENCTRCKSLIKKIHKNCSKFTDKTFAVFATGENKNLKRKLKHFIKKNVLVYTHPNIEELLDLGLTAVPSYIDKQKELHTGENASFNAIIKDKVCVK